MSSDQVNIKIVNDIVVAGQSTTLAKGSEFAVDGPTATALVLSGAAVQLPT